LYIADLQSVDNALYEAAAIDGAGFFRKLIHITIPHMSGLMKMFLIMDIIGIMQIYERPLAMTGGGPNGASKSLMILMYEYMFSQMHIGKATAMSVIVCFLLITLSLTYFRVSKKRGGAL